MGEPTLPSKGASLEPLLASIPPAVKVVLVFACGILVGEALSPGIQPLLGLSILLAGLGLGLWQSRQLPIISQLVLSAGLLVTACLWTRVAYLRPPHDVSRYASGERVAIEGVICRYPERRAGQVRLYLRTRGLERDGQRFSVDGEVMVRLLGISPRLGYGDLIRVDGRLRRPRSSRNPGEFNYRRYLKAEGISATLSIYRTDRIQLVRHGGGWWLLREVIYPVKSWMAVSIRGNVQNPQAAFIQSLLLGERGELPDEVREEFARSGVVHVLAVSGLHVGFVILVSMALFTLVRLPRPLQTAMTLLLLLFYVYLTNERSSVIRASVMGGLLLMARDLQRRAPVSNTIALAALVILIINPLALFQSGFQLSFTAVLGIVYLYPALDQLVGRTLVNRMKRHQLGRYTLGLLLVSVSAQLGTLPFTALYYGRIPLIALFANLLVIPLVFLVVGFAFVALMLAPLWPFVSHLYWESSGFVAAVVLRIVAASSRLPMASIEYPRPSILHAAVFFALLALLVGRFRRGARFAALLIVLVGLNLGVWKAAVDRPLLDVIFFDVGQADAALVTAPTGRTLLIDAGGRWEGSDSGEQTIAPYLRRHGIQRLDAVVFTHAHEDHYGGLPSLLRQVTVGEIYGPGQMSTAPSFVELRSLADSLGVRIHTLRRGDEIPGFEPMHLFVLHPTEAFLGSPDEEGEMNLNEGSVVLKLQYGEQKILFTGDAERRAEGQFARYGDFLQSTVLKVGHHGSRTSSSPGLIDEVRPRVAVVSVGEINSYGLPDEEPLERLERAGAQVLRTDQVGAVVVRSDGHRMWRVHWNAE